VYVGRSAFESEELMTGSVDSSVQAPEIKIIRVQTGVRIEKRMLKVLKALAEYFDVSLGDLLEGMVLHAFEGKVLFNTETLELIEGLKKIYRMDYDASASHHLVESQSGEEAS
jgi:hypothetical protein